jgi:hypothetical protein
MFRSLILSAFALVVSVPAFAQTPPVSEDDARPAIGVQYALMGIKEVEGTSSVGFDVNYASKMITQPVTSLGIRAGYIGEFGVHRFEDATLTLIQGGVQLKSDRVRTPRIVPSARIMAGIGKYPEGTDFALTLMPGLDFTLENRPYRFRVEVGQVWDSFDGGSLATWRWGFGIVLPQNR